MTYKPIVIRLFGKEKFMTTAFRQLKWPILAMGFIVLSSNILVNFFVPWVDKLPLFSGGLTYGAFTFPVAFLVTDTTNRIWGVKAARKVVLYGFFIGAVSSWFFGNPENIGQFFGVYEGNSNERIFLGLGLQHFKWIAIASMTAFLVGQLLDITIFNRLRQQSWWKAPVFSSLISSAIDKSIFFSLAFMGVEELNWLKMAYADWLAAIFMTIILLPFYKKLINEIMLIKKQKKEPI